MEATFIKFNKKSIFLNVISQNLEIRTVKRGLRTAIISNQMPHQPGSSGLLRVTFNIFEVFKDIFTLQTNSDASNDRNKHIKW